MIYSQSVPSFLPWAWLFCSSLFGKARLDIGYYYLEVRVGLDCIHLGIYDSGVENRYEEAKVLFLWVISRAFSAIVNQADLA